MLPSAAVQTDLQVVEVQRDKMDLENNHHHQVIQQKMNG